FPHSPQVPTPRRPHRETCAAPPSGVTQCPAPAAACLHRCPRPQKARKDFGSTERWVKPRSELRRKPACRSLPMGRTSKSPRRWTGGGGGKGKGTCVINLTAQ